MHLPSDEQKAFFELAASQYQRDLAVDTAGPARSLMRSAPPGGVTFLRVAELLREANRVSGCWESPRTPSQIYPRLHINGKMPLITRLVWTTLFGPLAEGYVVRHRCDNPRCIRPAHLVPGTASDNVRDAIERRRWKNQNSAKQRCKNNHPANWYVDRDGHRHCRHCNNERQRRRKAVRRASAQR